MHAFVMTNHSDRQEPAHERMIATECRTCGTPIRYAGRGRRPRYCSGSCRQRGWALRAAEEALSAGQDPRPEVVREVIERRPDEAAAGPDTTPESGRAWEQMLGQLAAQLADPDHRVHREHWHHQRIHRALVLAARNLGTAHPGGLDQLSR